MKRTIFHLILFVNWIAKSKGWNQGHNCPVFEEIPHCKPCQETCSEYLSDPNPRCQRICRPTKECYCQSGLLRTSNGDCVEKERCFEEEGYYGRRNIHDRILICPPGEEIPRCIPCQDSCSDYIVHPHLRCRRNCISTDKCFCKPGSLRNSNGNCVRVEKCHEEGNVDDGRPTPKGHPERDCPPGERIPGCKPCQETCLDHLSDPNPICTKDCQWTDKCYCKFGSFRTSAGHCVPAIQCSSEESYYNSQLNTFPLH